MPRWIKLDKAVASLAHEHVPIYAMARGMNVPPDIIRELCEAALFDGYIVAMPPQDWPVGQRGVRYDRRRALKIDDPGIIQNAMKVFRTTPLEAYLLAVLLTRGEATKVTLYAVVQSRRDHAKDETDPKMVDVVICHLRKKLKPHKLKIKTLWGRGYFMEPDQREEALRLLGVFEDVEPGEYANDNQAKIS